MTDAIKALYALAEKYGVPKDEVKDWLTQYTKEFSYSYCISTYTREFWPDKVDDIETQYNREGVYSLASSLPFSKSTQQFENHQITIMKIMVLTDP